MPISLSNVSIYGTSSVNTFSTSKATKIDGVRFCLPKYIESIVLHTLSAISLPSINPNWFLCMQYGIICFTLFTRVAVKIFESWLSCSIRQYEVSDVVSLLGFSIAIIVDCFQVWGSRPSLRIWLQSAFSLGTKIRRIVDCRIWTEIYRLPALCCYEAPPSPNNLFFCEIRLQKRPVFLCYLHSRDVVFQVMKDSLWIWVCWCIEIRLELWHCL